MNSDETVEQVNSKLNALVALAALSLEKNSNGISVKPEEVRGRCGIRPDEIAAILGKNEAAVRKTLHRAGIRLRDTKKGKK